MIYLEMTPKGSNISADGHAIRSLVKLVVGPVFDPKDLAALADLDKRSLTNISFLVSGDSARGDALKEAGESIKNTISLSREREF